MTNNDTMHGPSQFPTTRWTLVIAASDPQREEARSALVSLCEGYCIRYTRMFGGAAIRLTGRRISRRSFSSGC